MPVQPASILASIPRVNPEYLQPIPHEVGGDRHPPEDLGEAPRFPSPDLKPVADETPPPGDKGQAPKGILKVVYQSVVYGGPEDTNGCSTKYRQRVLVDLRNRAFILNEKLTPEEEDRMLDEFLERRSVDDEEKLLLGNDELKRWKTDKSHSSVFAYTDPNSHFYYFAGGTVDPAKAKGPLVPEDSPDALDALLGWPNGIPNHLQGGSNGNSNTGTSPGGNGTTNSGSGPNGAPDGSNKPDKGGILGNPGKETSQGKGQEQDKGTGPMPPAGKTTVEVENENEPPPPESPEHDCPNFDVPMDQILPSKQPVPSDSDHPGWWAGGGIHDSGANGGGSDDGGGGGGSDDGGGNGGGNNNGGTSSNGQSSDDDDDDDDSGSSNDEAMASSDSEEGGSSDDEASGYTPGSGDSEGGRPASADELRYALFQALGYYFHSRNFGPKFPLVGDPLPERGGPDASGAHGAGQHNQPAFDSDDEPEGEEELNRPQSGPPPGVAVNPDQWKNPNPNAADKPSIKSGFNLPRLQVFDPVPDQGP
jgi:hypothetical protein